jgi:hypothetical protein
VRHNEVKFNTEICSMAIYAVLSIKYSLLDDCKLDYLFTHMEVAILSTSWKLVRAITEIVDRL